MRCQAVTSKGKQCKRKATMTVAYKPNVQRGTTRLKHMCSSHAVDAHTKYKATIYTMGMFGGR